MKRTISLKLFLTVIVRGICQMFGYIGRLFGYKDRNSFTKVLWRISAFCLTSIIVIFTGCTFHALYTEIIYPKWIRPMQVEGEWYNDRYLT